MKETCQKCCLSASAVCNNSYNTPTTDSAHSRRLINDRRDMYKGADKMRTRTGVRPAYADWRTRTGVMNVFGLIQNNFQTSGAIQLK